MSLNTVNVSVLCVGKRLETYLRSFAPLENGPIYVLIRHFDVASLAMDATRNDSNGVSIDKVHHVSRSKRKKGRDSLLGVNLEAHAEVLVVILHILVHARGTEPILDSLVLWPLHLSMLVPILHLQMHWLIFFVIRSCP